MQEFVRQIASPIYERFGGFDAMHNKSDAVDLIKHKVLLTSWACRYEVGDCKEKALALFNSWMRLENPDEQNPFVHFDPSKYFFVTA